MIGSLVMDRKKQKYGSRGERLPQYDEDGGVTIGPPYDLSKGHLQVMTKKDSVSNILSASKNDILHHKLLTNV
jgi:hypothetical protein